MSVPVWLIVLSDQLPIIALVGHYPANELIGRRLIQRRGLRPFLQAFAHCAIVLTAASRRSLARVSVPMWGVTLSRPLRIIALVGPYPTN